jgi:hypothetical protein
VIGTAFNLNQPGHYLHWSVFTISVVNLAVIVVMLVIFVAALLLPFPAGRRKEQLAGPGPAPPGGGSAGPGARPGGPGAAVAGVKPGEITTADDFNREDRDEGDSDQPPPANVPRGAAPWTARLRRTAVRLLPPGRILPDTQPSYVASWIYVFGVASLVALVIVIVSGFLIALGGVDWWHTNPVGHFFNSLHLWSVELFMAFMVIHLWGKFFMAAWRGQRARTWITGVLAFLVSVVEAFTGYLSQQNFDSQWIATNGKDAFNAAGIGAFFNLMNFGQMLLWHVVLMPLVLVAIVALHVLFVRYRGVVHPFPAKRGRDPLGQRIATPVRHLTKAQLRAADRAEWRGPVRQYDIIREGVAAMAIVIAATVGLAGLLSSPDLRAISIQKWAQANPSDFVGTAATELAGTSLTATYGPPYNHGNAAVQTLGISWQKMAGVRIPIDTANDFVINPLTSTGGTNGPLASALARWKAAEPAQQMKWANNYADATAKLSITPLGRPVVPPGNYGPVTTIMTFELQVARAGGLDASLVAGNSFYGTDYTKPLLFMADGGYYGDQAQAQHLQGDQWGVMNETGSYPGQPWLWLYQLWYHLPGFDHSANVDLIAIYLTGAATLLLVLIPFIPGLRDLPRLVRVYRLVWRSYYRDAEGRAKAP